MESSTDEKVVSNALMNPSSEPSANTDTLQSNSTKAVAGLGVAKQNTANTIAADQFNGKYRLSNPLLHTAKFRGSAVDCDPGDGLKTLIYPAELDAAIASLKKNVATYWTAKLEV
eukprot:1318409-Amorphochlora_amoeboformis.AAC.1